MKKNIYPITFLIIAFFAFAANAQTVKLIAPTIEVMEGEDFVDIPIQVESFSNISGLQFTLKWDAEVLEFMYVDSLNFGLDFMTFRDNFGLTDITDGVMTFYWEDITATGQEADDGTVIFTIKTKVIGNPGALTTIEFIGDPTAIEISTPQFDVLPYELVTGSVKLEGSSSAVQRAVENARISLTPNPFREKTTLEFYLDGSSQTQIEIYDLEGRRIYNQADFLGSGKHNFQIDKTTFPAVGIYLLKITTEGFQTSKKLFYVR